MKRMISAAVNPNHIFDNVTSELYYIAEDTIDDMVKGLADKMANSISGYNAKWCPADPNKLSKNPSFAPIHSDLEQAKSLIVNACLRALFMDAPESIRRRI